MTAAPVMDSRSEDPGEGMPPAVLERIFDPFYTTKKDGGGLGLSICRDAVQRHGGNITVSSQQGVGTVVCLDFPMLVEHGTHSRR
jgi:signal transduction histidine kinase